MENTRVGDATDYDKLTLEVWTDGTITARDAVSLGARILCDHFVLFTDLSETMGSKSTVVEKAETQRDKVLELTIEERSVCLLLQLPQAGQHQHRRGLDLKTEDDDEGANPGPQSLKRSSTSWG